MQVGVPRERTPGERRVAAVPDVVRQYREWGWDVVVEADAGTAAGFTDDAYRDAGATIGEPDDANIVVFVGPPSAERLATVRSGAIVVGFLEPFTGAAAMRMALERGHIAVAVEAIPRTTLAQAMDALSSQANIAGYAAVLVAAAASPRLLPMMVTAAGTIAPSKAVILGVGVAGLQAIATARRLGAVVHAYDIRTETREQVESLGARFIAAVTTDADEGGYAREVAADTQQLQHEALAPYLAEADIVITTAQIPGRPAPLLVTDEMLAQMRPGAVIVDMAAATGGNVSASRPDEVVVVGGVHIHGPTNLAAAQAADASRMYARNVAALLGRARNLHGENDGFAFDLDDEILGTAAVVAAGAARHPRTIELLGETPAEPPAEPHREPT